MTGIDDPESLSRNSRWTEANALGAPFRSGHGDDSFLRSSRVPALATVATGAPGSRTSEGPGRLAGAGTGPPPAEVSRAGEVSHLHGEDLPVDRVRPRTVRRAHEGDRDARGVVG